MISCEDPVFANDTTHARIAAAFGTENMKVVSEPGPEGSPPNVKTMRQAKPTLHQVQVVYPRDPIKRQ